MDTKNLLVTEATKLFYANGYKSVGLSKIINVTNTSKGSFYHHFPKGKEQLLVACLTKVQQDIVYDIQHHFIRHLTFKDAILSLLTDLIQMYDEKGQINGYTFTIMLSEINGVSDEVHEKCGELYRRIEEVFSTQLQRRGLSLEVAKHQALILVSLIEGSILQSIMKKSSEPLRIMAQHIGQYINIED